MCRADDLIVLPALPVPFLPHTVFVAQFAMAIRKGLSPPRKVGQTFQELAHSPLLSQAIVTP
jgi:hypothetical protein